VVTENSILSNFGLAAVCDARSAFVTRITEARRARADATAARTKADEIRQQTATPELRASRDRFAAEFRNVPAILK